MSLKDWILLLVPIVFNGILVLFIQICFEQKKMRKEIKMPYYRQFSDLLKKLNNTFVSENFEVQINGKDVVKAIPVFQQYIFEILKYYDSNRLYLKKITTDYVCLINSWADFNKQVKRTKGALSEKNRKILGEKLQNVKLKLDKLNYVVDKVMLK